MAIIEPATAENQGITWHVENESGEASINGIGLMTAIEPGTVTVVATAQDGSNISGSMQITISSDKVMVSTVKVNNEVGETELPVGKRVQFLVDILPLDATKKEVIWRVIDITGDAGITQDGLFVGIESGTVDVVAIALDGSGKRDTLGITIANDWQTGLNGSGFSDLLLYPNPSTGLVKIVPGDLEVTMVEVIGLGGVLIEEIIPNTGMEIFEIDLTHRSAGTYFLRIRSVDEEIMKKVLILD